MEKVSDNEIGNVIEKLDGLKANRDEILHEKKRLQEELKQWEGLDPVHIKETLKNIEKNHLGKLIAEGKYEEANNLQVEMMEKNYKKQLEEKETKILTLTQASKALEDKLNQQIVKMTLQTEAVKVGMHSSAVEDAVLRGMAQATVSDQGITIGDQSVSEWVMSMRGQAPHWWPMSTGAGAVGGNKVSNDKKMEKMSAVEKLTRARQGK